MNIYEQLNKINDKESLSEKYNVKNVKELKKLQEDSSKLTEYTLSKDDVKALKIWQKKVIDAVSGIHWAPRSYRKESDGIVVKFDTHQNSFYHSAKGFRYEMEKSNFEEVVANALNDCPYMYEISVDPGRHVYSNGMYHSLSTGVELKLYIDSKFSSKDEATTIEPELTESSNGKQDVRHEAQRIHDELVNKGYTDEEIKSIFSILHTAAINNFEPARPKLKAAFPDLDI